MIISFKARLTAEKNSAIALFCRPICSMRNAMAIAFCADLKAGRYLNSQITGCSANCQFTSVAWGKLKSNLFFF
jgi:hypothetical protein